MAISLPEQIKCIEREIGYRKRVYPRLVDQGRMKLDQSDYQIAAMEAVLATLREAAKAEQLL